MFDLTLDVINDVHFRLPEHLAYLMKKKNIMSQNNIVNILQLRGNIAWEPCRAVTIHQTHDSVRITIFDPRFGSYHDFFVGGGRKKKKDF